VDTVWEVSVEEEAAQVQIESPHVVILGAGASRAAFPHGEATGRQLPLMNDLVRLSGIAKLLGHELEGSNFEQVYSDIASQPDKSGLREALELEIQRYFSALRLPEGPTIYDHLVLSLRSKDVIATFNWDPFLIEAARRNRALTPNNYPQLVFLHGNVLAGFCSFDKVLGTVGTRCSRCGNTFKPSRLLYPVVDKDYRSDPAIAAGWEFLALSLRRAFMVTIFGYSAPTSDASAIGLLKSAWGSPKDRWMEEFEIIDIREEAGLRHSWSDFIHTHHYEVHSDFYSSFIANHPRRTGEAYRNQFMHGRFITPNPIPREASISELSAWFEPLLSAEGKATMASQLTTD